jgi:hypothetical protein
LVIAEAGYGKTTALHGLEPVVRLTAADRDPHVLAETIRVAAGLHHPLPVAPGSPGEAYGLTLAIAMGH